ncbi:MULTISPECIES: hypothetical protein [unclassified Microcoleus]|uniref:hypothetical protein n=1 Tax=unclassified Microcoleus TaxID=2642155 RepID=UPI001D31F396|nr:MULTISPECIES: hypothetical protein [unclassified Microcoleus]MCC3465887.1 hypothetical protein [Microcoleus sp. PH2017_06_SFM_O_A]MCC3412269.1 hypothetical protein [Microcoleus sp. PH2017_02_FOX_O_A]MCC3435424.1 hypothetical protein [Microcoleus sp. PH2017_05_CCC_O_A]MCC3448713.1 hypothetical protein [Microcoleus sp. PH2017_09_SFU_O_A]MCC3472252.1 hypothetical protein [Microcoleus sp. PH2017_13_LAR_U_A]
MAVGIFRIRATNQFPNSQICCEFPRGNRDRSFDRNCYRDPGKKDTVRSTLTIVEPQI